MKKLLLLISSLCGLSSSLEATSGHLVQQVGVIRTPDSRPCTFFTLVGVVQSDPITPNVPWFALPKTDPGYNEKLSFLLSAKLASKPVNVYTDGAISCGHATALTIEIP